MLLSGIAYFAYARQSTPSIDLASISSYIVTEFLRCLDCLITSLNPEMVSPGRIDLVSQLSLHAHSPQCPQIQIEHGQNQEA